MTSARDATLTLQGVPARLRGALRTAMRTGLELISERTSPLQALQELRGWKLFLLAPRMLLHRSAGQARIPPAELALRCEAFARGGWLTLLQAAAGTAAPHLAAARSAAQDIEARAHRAAALVHLGELSAAGHALTAEPLAPATDATLAELRDGARPNRTVPCRPRLPTTSPKSPARSRCLPSLPACGKHGVELLLAPLELPTSTSASFWTTRSIASSCTAPRNALRKPMCQPRLSQQSVLAGSLLCKNRMDAASAP